MRDYSERRPVSPNRPRKKQGGGPKFLILAILLPPLVTFVLGFGAGWWASRRSILPQDPRTAQAQPGTAPVAAGTSLAPAGTQEPPLTFYDSLSKGKGIIGTGLNPARPGDPASPAQPAAPAPAPPEAQAPATPAPPAKKPVPPATPPAAAPAQAQPAAAAPKPPQAPAPKPAAPAPAKDAAAPAKPAADGKAPPAKPTSNGNGAPAMPAAPAAAPKAVKGKYVVQAASYTTKAEAAAKMEKLEDRGFDCYIAESSISGKGKAYRVRIGKGMDFAAASALAAKVGGGAFVILE